MIPIKQTSFGKDKGNCMAACVASILEVSLEEIPDLVTALPKWREALNDYLFTKELYLLTARLDEPKKHLKGFHIIAGQSPRHDCLHAIVGYAGQPYFDPHPDNSGLAGNPNDWEYDLFLKLFTE